MYNVNRYWFIIVDDTKNVSTDLKAKAKAWIFETKAISSETKAIKICPRGQGLALRTTSLHLVGLDDWQQ